MSNACSHPCAVLQYGKDEHGKTHWKAERYTSIALWGLLPAAVLAPSSVVDYGLAVVLPIHTTAYACVLGLYWLSHPYSGLDMIITDYVHGKLTVPVMRAGNYALGAAAVRCMHFCHAHVTTLLQFAGFMFLNLYDVGITAAVQQIWTI